MEPGQSDDAMGEDHRTGALLLNEIKALMIQVYTAVGKLPIKLEDDQGIVVAAIPAEA